MPALQLVVTRAGYDALTNAAGTGTDAVVISQVGVTTQSFVAADTLTALPNELKRVDTVAGVVTGPNTLNLVLRDDSADGYAMRGFGLYLDDGTLFAAYSADAVIVEKSPLVAVLLTIDAAFVNVDTALVEFGDTNFVNPLATTEVVGVVELATQAEAEAGVDAGRAVTVKVLHDVVRARTITGGGLVTGGGDLTGNRVLTVAEASEAEALAGVDGTKAMTARRVKAAIDALIAGAPGALDTLNELSAALGDDPDFAATVTNELALKATISYVDAQLAAARTLLQDERRGDVVFRATQTVPAGAYECDGRALSRTGDDAALFAVIGTSYGAGDGATTFNIPDMRGQFPRGWDHGAGVDPGRVWGSSQDDMLETHTHSIPANDDQATGNGFVEDAAGSGTARITNTGATGGTETRPKNVAGMFIIWR